MKTYFLVFSLLLFFSFSLEAQTTKRVNKKPKVERRKVKPDTKKSSLPFKGTDEELQALSPNRPKKGTGKVVDHKADDQKVRRGTPNVVDHKADDQKVRRGTPKVVDHKADDQKLRKGRTGNRQRMKRGNAPGRKMKNKTGTRNTTKRKRRNN